MARWLHTLQQFQFFIVHRAGCDHGNADGLSRVPTSPCGQCACVDCPPRWWINHLTRSLLVTRRMLISFLFNPVRIGWLSLMICPDFRITALQLQDSTCITLLTWIRSDVFPPWAEVMSLFPELRLLWHHRNNLLADANGVIWRKRSSPGSELQLLVPKPAREQLFLAYHTSLFGGHLSRNQTLARLSHRFYWSGMSDDVKDWLGSLHEEEVAHRSSTPFGQYSHRSSLGSPWIFFGCLSVHIGHHRLLQQVDRGFSHQEQMRGHGGGCIGGTRLFYGLTCLWLFTAARGVNLKMA